jgi:hypothetical protein
MDKDNKRYTSFNPDENNLNEPQDFDKDSNQEQKEVDKNGRDFPPTKYDADPTIKYRNVNPDEYESGNNPTSSQSNPGAANSDSRDDHENTQFPRTSDETMKTNPDTGASQDSGHREEDENK